MFSSVVFDLESLNEFPRFNASHVHACALALIGSVDPDLRARLHAGHTHRPFTAWAGRRFALHRDDHGRALTHLSGWCLRLTSLDVVLSRVLARIAAGWPSSLRLGAEDFRILAVASESDVNTWAGVLTNEQLLERWKHRRASRFVTLRFLSATAFGSHEERAGFPDPGRVFGSLRRKWNESCGHDLPAAAICDDISVNAYDISTGIVDFGEHRRRGFIGRVEFALPKISTIEARRAMHIMSDFAFFAGVGMQTARGMGQVVCESHE